MPPYCCAAVGVLAKVAGRRDDYDAALRQATGGQRQRIDPVRLGDGRANRKIDDADVVGARVGGYPVQRGDDRADRSLALGVEHLQRHQRRVRRHPGLAAVRVESVAEDDAGDVRTVAVIVVGHRLPVDEVDELRDALVGVRITRPVRRDRSSCQDVMPESITAMPTPRPVKPYERWATSALVARVDR